MKMYLNPSASQVQIWWRICK